MIRLLDARGEVSAMTCRSATSRTSVLGLYVSNFRGGSRSLKDSRNRRMETVHLLRPCGYH
jgi:hypothetical protein